MDGNRGEDLRWDIYVRKSLNCRAEQQQTGQAENGGRMKEMMNTRMEPAVEWIEMCEIWNKCHPLAE